VPAFALRVAYDAEVLRGFEDALELEIHVLLALLAFITCGSLCIRALENPVDCFTHSEITDDDEARRLHKSYRRRAVCRGQQTV